MTSKHDLIIESTNTLKVKMVFLWVMTASLFGCETHHTAPVTDLYTTPIPKSGEIRVKPGDTLYSLAWNYGVDYRQLAKINHIDAPYSIKTGQKIRFRAFVSSPTLHFAKNKYQIISGQYSHKIGRSSAYLSATAEYKLTPSKRSLRGDPIGPMSWSWPTKGKIIMGFKPNDPRHRNTGINIAGNLGQAVLAAARGTVVYSGSGLLGYGNLLIVKHNAEFLSAYAHNSKVLVKEGQIVKAGQKIAEMGSSGTDKTMLHFEIRRSGHSVNPLQYLPSTH